MQPSIFQRQNMSRDECVGVELMRACAERLLAVRLYSGYSSVKSGLCSVIAGEGGFGSPTVTLTDAPGNPITGQLPCSTATCTATINIAKPPATAPALAPLTLQLSAY